MRDAVIFCNRESIYIKGGFIAARGFYVLVLSSAGSGYKLCICPRVIIYVEVPLYDVSLKTCIDFLIAACRLRLCKVRDFHKNIKWYVLLIIFFDGL